MLGYGPAMRTLMLTILIACAALPACSHGSSDASATPPDPDKPIKLTAVTVDELARLLADQAARPVDANSDDTRRRMGIIPGAVLLRDADLLDKLPADKAAGLVFYCTNDACSASHHAARKAIVAGYKNVKILPVGIAGWVKAGKPTATI
jgi:rhodanese-related sulfurtransferase